MRFLLQITFRKLFFIFFLLFNILDIYALSLLIKVCLKSRLKRIKFQHLMSTFIFVQSYLIFCPRKRKVFGREEIKCYKIEIFILILMFSKYQLSIYITFFSEISFVVDLSSAYITSIAILVFFHLACYYFRLLRFKLFIYRSGTLNSNTVNSKFHLIRSFFEIFARFLSFCV